MGALKDYNGERCRWPVSFGANESLTATEESRSARLRVVNVALCLWYTTSTPWRLRTKLAIMHISNPFMKRTLNLSAFVWRAGSQHPSITSSPTPAPRGIRPGYLLTACGPGSDQRRSVGDSTADISLSLNNHDCCAHLDSQRQSPINLSVSE